MRCSRRDTSNAPTATTIALSFLPSPELFCPELTRRPARTPSSPPWKGRDHFLAAERGQNQSKPKAEDRADPVRPPDREGSSPAKPSVPFAVATLEGVHYETISVDGRGWVTGKHSASPRGRGALAIGHRERQLAHGLRAARVGQLLLRSVPFSPYAGRRTSSCSPGRTVPSRPTLDRICSASSAGRTRSPFDSASAVNPGCSAGRIRRAFGGQRGWERDVEIPRVYMVEPDGFGAIFEFHPPFPCTSVLEDARVRSCNRRRRHCQLQ